MNDEQTEPSIAEIIEGPIINELSILPKVEKRNLATLLIKYESFISCGPTNLENCKLLTHHIDTKDTTPIQMAPRRIPYFQEEVQDDINSKEAAGIVQNSTSP